MPPRVMISYSHMQNGFVESLLARLRAANAEVWIDREGVCAGKPWRKELIDAVRTCDVIIPVLAPAFLRSAPCRWEVLTARSFDKKIIPVMVEDCTADLPKYPRQRAWRIFS